MSFTVKLTIASVVFGLLFALIPLCLWLLCLVLGRLFHFSFSFAPFGWSALALALLVWGAEAYGYFWGRYRLEVTHVDYLSPRVPSSFEGYRVVQLSDIHLQTFLGHPEALQRVVDSVNAQQPDLICFTGDLVNLDLSEFDSLAPIISGLRAADGVVSVLGNHDLFIYRKDFSPEQRVAARAALAERQRSIGWHVLRNEHLVLHRGADSLTIVGIDNYHGGGQGFRTINLGDLPKALRGVGEESFSILLIHDPSLWESDVLGRTAVDLTLSGHTHAAQVRFFGWSPASLLFHQSQGRYDSQGQTLYVNRGIGCTLPVRIGCPSEITVINFSSLRNKED